MCRRSACRGKNLLTFAEESLECVNTRAGQHRDQQVGLGEVASARLGRLVYCVLNLDSDTCSNLTSLDDVLGCVIDLQGRAAKERRARQQHHQEDTRWPCLHLAQSDDFLLLRFRIDLDDTDRGSHSDRRALDKLQPVQDTSATHSAYPCPTRMHEHHIRQ